MKRRTLWRCPRCGHRFVVPNSWHSCGKVPLADHFRGRDLKVKAAFDRVIASMRRHGPLTVIPQKTRIAVMVEVRFAHLTTRRRWLDLGLWLTRKADHPTLRRVEAFGPKAVVHTFRLTSPEEVDPALEALIAEACAVGRGEHRFGTAGPRRRRG